MSYTILHNVFVAVLPYLFIPIQHVIVVVMLKESYKLMSEVSKIAFCKCLLSVLFIDEFQ